MTIGVGSTVVVTGGKYEGHEGVVQLISGPVLYVATDELVRPFYESELSMLAVPERKTSKQATQSVLRNLKKSEDYSLPPDTGLELFTTTARAWLEDNSTLKVTTLDNADWQEVYNHFKG